MFADAQYYKQTGSSLSSREGMQPSLMYGPNSITAADTPDLYCTLVRVSYPAEIKMKRTGFLKRNVTSGGYAFTRFAIQPGQSETGHAVVIRGRQERPWATCGPVSTTIALQAGAP